LSLNRLREKEKFTMKKVRQGREETSMAELRPAGQTEDQEAVEAGTGILGRV